jgi:hypothetical protein
MPEDHVDFYSNSVNSHKPTHRRVELDNGIYRISMWQIGTVPFKNTLWQRLMPMRKCQCRISDNNKMRRCTLPADLAPRMVELAVKHAAAVLSGA